MRTLVVTLLLMCAAKASMACSCARPLGVSGELERSELVADGTVVAIEDRQVGWRKIKVWLLWRFGPPYPTVLDDGFAITLKLHQVWKGSASSETVLYTARVSAACGFPFERGYRYVVYANELEDGEYQASLCSRTRPRTDDEVATLDTLSSSKKF